MAQLTAHFHEIFSGIQGEGTLVGVRQLFVRFHGCHLACRYCDTPASQGAPPALCRVETHAGARTMTPWPNQLTVDAVLHVIMQMQVDYPHHSVSLTGGEPLLQVPFLQALLPALRDMGVPSYLETNGVLADALGALPSLPDYIAMDIKLPSVAGEACWDEHAAFLQQAVRGYLAAGLSPRERLQVKVVFGEESLAEVAQAALLIAAVDVTVPCVLQPLTPHPGGPPAPTPATVLEAQRLAAQHLRDVRVIPQTHVLLGQW